MRAAHAQQSLGVDMARRPKCRQCCVCALPGNDMAVWTALSVCAAASQVAQHAPPCLLKEVAKTDEAA